MNTNLTTRERAAIELLRWLDSESVLTGIEDEERHHIASQWASYCEDRQDEIREETRAHADGCTCDPCAEYRALG